MDQTTVWFIKSTIIGESGKDHLHFVHDDILSDILHPNGVNDPIHLMQIIIIVTEDEHS